MRSKFQSWRTCLSQSLCFNLLQTYTQRTFEEQTAKEDPTSQPIRSNSQILTLCTLSLQNHPKPARSCSLCKGFHQQYGLKSLVAGNLGCRGSYQQRSFHPANSYIKSHLECSATTALGSTKPTPAIQHHLVSQIHLCKFTAPRAVLRSRFNGSLLDLRAPTNHLWPLFQPESTYQRMILGFCLQLWLKYLRSWKTRLSSRVYKLLSGVPPLSFPTPRP